MKLMSTQSPQYTVCGEKCTGSSVCGTVLMAGLYRIGSGGILPLRFMGGWKPPLPGGYYRRPCL